MLEAKRITAIANTAVVSIITLTGETNNREDTLIMCEEELTRFILR